MKLQYLYGGKVCFRKFSGCFGMVIDVYGGISES